MKKYGKNGPEYAKRLGPPSEWQKIVAPKVRVPKSLPGLVDNTEQLLRIRLRSLALFLSCVLGITLLLTVDFDGTHHWIHRIGAPLAFLGVLTLWILLKSRAQWSVSGLHNCEFAILGAAAIMGVVVPLCLVPRAADAGDVFSSLAVVHANFAAWAILILTYGIFIPNTAKRAALISMPLACLPLLVNLWLRSHSEAVADAMAHRQSWLSAPLPFVAALAAVYAAHTLTQLRRDLFTARQLGQYHLRRKLGEGGMGEVYEAEHVLLKRRCALKLIRRELQSAPYSVVRFEREVKAAAELTHWNTIDIFDFGYAEDGRFYYVMALLNGLNLQSLVERYGPLEPGRAIYFLCQACNALAEAHSRGLIHRDLKPANLYAGQRGGVWDHVTLLDFGLVRGEIPFASGEAEPTAVVGSPLYMSPEQITKSGNIDARADIYSVGAVAYFLLSGRPPFETTNLMEAMIATIQDSLQPLRTLVSDLPNDLAEIVERCLQKHPADRFSSVAELRGALESCQSAGDWNLERAAKWWERVDLESEQSSGNSSSVSIVVRTSSVASEPVPLHDTHTEVP